VLSVFSMYGPKGKLVLVALFVGGAAGLGLAGMKYARPYLEEKKAKKEKELADAEAAKKKPEAPKPAPAVTSKSGNGGPSKLERVFIGKRDPMIWPKDGVVPEGGMILAFFDKESDFKDAKKSMKDDPAAFKKLEEERETELAVTLAWIRAKADDRKKSFEKDEFPLPAELKGKPLTADFLANDKGVKIRTLLETRCSSCHGETDKVQLDTLDKIEKFLK